MSEETEEVKVIESPTSEPTSDLVSPDEEAINRIAFEQGMSCLRSQNSLLDNMRQRASAIGALAGLAATVLGREALNDNSRDRILVSGTLDLFEILALLALGVSVLCIIQIIRPYQGWSFDFRPSLIMSQFARGPNATTLAETYEVLARYAEQRSDTNQKLLRRLQRWFWASIIAVVVQMYFWLFDLA
jgi:hypothetical protein